MENIDNEEKQPKGIIDFAKKYERKAIAKFSEALEYLQENPVLVPILSLTAASVSYASGIHSDHPINIINSVMAGINISSATVVLTRIPTIERLNNEYRKSQQISN